MSTTRWYCDSCNGLIEKPEDGWVEWIACPDDSCRDMRIVHNYDVSKKLWGKVRCQFDRDVESRKDGGYIRDLPLQRLMEPNGLMTLLALIVEGEIPQNEVLEIIKRIHIPGYEEARLYIDEAEREGAYTRNTLQGFPHVNQIDGILKFVEEARARGDLQ